MGSPIDARGFPSPTAPNRLAAERPFTWFASNMIYTVPPPYVGALRRVYPGFVQLYSFLRMNAEAHQAAHRRYFDQLVVGDGDSADKHRAFYDEYLSVLDLTEEFYLETVDIVFQRHLLATGGLEHRGRRVDPAAMTDIGLMTIEGEKDDISGVGQTQAAHGLTPNIPADLRELHVPPAVGHYGVFNGARFQRDIYPRLRAFIGRCQEAEKRCKSALSCARMRLFKLKTAGPAYADGQRIEIGGIAVRLRVSQRARLVSLRIDPVRGEVVASALSERLPGERRPSRPSARDGSPGRRARQPLASATAKPSPSSARLIAWRPTAGGRASIRPAA